MRRSSSTPPPIRTSASTRKASWQTCICRRTVLRTLADETGGYAAVNSNNVATALNRIVRAEQHVLRARLLPEGRAARRTIPQDRSSREAARASCLRAKGLCLAAAADAPKSGCEQERERERGRGRAGDSADVERAARDSESAASTERPDARRAGRALQRRGAAGVGRRGHRSSTPAVCISPNSRTRRSPTDIELSLFALDERGTPARRQASISSTWRCGPTPTSACASRSFA